MTLQSVLRTLQSILSMPALLPLQSLSILNEYPECSPPAQFNTEVVVSSCDMRKVFIFWCEIFDDYATIYNSINRLLPPPPPRDPRPRGGHSSRHPVVDSMSSDRCSLHLSRDNIQLNHQLNQQLNHNHVTIYSSINRVRPPPLDHRTRGGHSSRHPVPPSGASWSLPRAASITRQ